MEQDKNGKDRVNRINYEVCVLRALRKRLRTKEIWVEGADRYRNPEQDLPADFDEKRDTYYDDAQRPEGRGGVHRADPVRHAARPENTERRPSGQPKVACGKQGKNMIHLSPLEAQTEPPNTAALKREIGRRWSDVELIDIVKEVDLRLNFTVAFRTTASREALDPALLQRRLLLCLFGIGTNVGLKRVASQQPSVTFEELRYVKRRFVNKEALRAAVAESSTAPSASVSRDLGRGHHLVRLRLQAVRCLRSEPDDRMARALWRARHHDLLARRHQFDLHLLADRVAHRRKSRR
jgi:hypothetical protein